MEERRLDQVIREYEQAVAADVEAMARAEGLECTGASVQIDGDRNSSRYGQIEGIGLVISGEKADTEQGSWDYMGSRPVNVDAGRIDSVKVEDVELGELPETGGVENNGDTPEQGRGGGRRHGGGQKINHLTGKVAQYYGLEESDIQIQWKMTKEKWLLLLLIGVLLMILSFPCPEEAGRIRMPGADRGGRHRGRRGGSAVDKGQYKRQRRGQRLWPGLLPKRMAQGPDGNGAGASDGREDSLPGGGPHIRGRIL